MLRVEGTKGDLDLLFVSPKAHSKGIGYAAWCEVEKLYPQVTLWETVTPYFEKRNIHFYVNRCGFHIVEFYNSHHPNPNDPDSRETLDEQVGQLKLSLNIVIPFCFFNLFGLFLTDSQYSPSEEWNAAYNLVQRIAQCKACRKAQNVNCPYRNGFRLSD